MFSNLATEIEKEYKVVLVLVYMEKSIEFVPVDYDYFDFGGQNYVKMVGRDGNGKRVLVVDSYEANFYLILKEGCDEEKVIERVMEASVEKSGRKSRALKTEVLEKKFLGKDVRAVRVWISNHKDLQAFVSEIGDLEDVECRREWDMGIVTKYIKENGVEPMGRYLVKVKDDECFAMDTGLDSLDVEGVYLAESISKVKEESKFVPKVMSYDIETTGREIGEGEILMISVCSGEGRKVFSWKDIDGSPDYVVKVKDEADMIEGFCDYVRNEGVDILTGYFSDGFDLPYLRERARKLKVVLDLGINGKNPSFARGMIPSGKISGVVHVDLYRFVSSVFSQYLKSETLSLNEVASELVGGSKEDFDFARLKNMEDKDWLDFFSYSLQDAVVTYDLALKLWPDLNEFVKIVKEPVFDVSRNTMARHVENHILHNLDRFDEIAERRPGHSEMMERKGKRAFEGAFVFEPTPGLYEDIAMFDFTSMHSSLMVTYNICGQALRSAGSEDVNVSPEFELNGHPTRVYFDKKLGFFSTLLSEIVDLRKAAKEEWKKNGDGMSKARSNAYKLLANATFGYQGFFGARYYSYEAAAATLAYVRKLIHDTMDEISGAGFKVLYGDTDSIAFLKNGKSDDEIREFLKKINEKFPGIIELDLEGFFKRGLFVAKRGVKLSGVGGRGSGVGKNQKAGGGAKKKYALLGEDGKIKIRGFETVRRDWCGLSRKLQDKVIRDVLNEGNEKEALKEVKGVVDRLKKREVDVGELVIKTKMKREVGDYVALGPHVAAAKKMIARGDNVGVGTFVDYFIGEGASKKVRDRVFLMDEKVKYDSEYYLKKQVLPAVENIFDVFGVDVNAEIEGEKQQTLF